MPVTTPNSLRAATVPPASRSSSRLARGGQRSVRSRSAPLSDAGPSLSPNQTATTHRTSTISNLKHSKSSTKQAVDAPLATIASPSRVIRPKVAPHGPVNVAESPHPPLPPRQRDCKPLVPLIIFFSICLALRPSWLFALPGPEVLAIPPLTRHVQSSANLLEYVPELQAPHLDHLPARIMRGAAGFAKLDALRSDLHVLAEHLIDAKLLVMELGVSIWSAGSTTHTELSHVLSSLSTSSTSKSAVGVNRATEYVAGKLLNLRTSAATTHALLVSAHELGLRVTQSADWSNLEQSVGATRRLAWLRSQPDDNNRRLSTSARDTVTAIERCVELARYVEEVQGDIEAMFENLRDGGARDRGTRSRESNQLLMMSEELREALAGLEADVKRTQYNKN